VAAFTGLGGSIPMDWVATFTGIRNLNPDKTKAKESDTKEVIIQAKKVA